MKDQTKLLTVAGSLGLVCFAIPVAAPADPSPADETHVLATVNGDDITSADLDALIVQSHRGMSPEKRTAFDFRRLLDKLVNDRLLIQQAEQLGLDQEPGLLDRVRKSRIENAVQKYVAATYAGPDSIRSDAVRDYFILGAIRQGASMDSIAQAVSVDVHRYRGGLHNLKVWADVENEIRNAVVDLKVGQLSDPFPYRESYAFVRVEERHPLDDADLGEYEGEIRKYLRGAERERSWKRFVEDHLERTPIRVDSDVITRIVADSAKMFTADFVVRSDAPVLSIGETHVTEFDLRKALSHKAMSAALAPFDSLLSATIDAKKGDLVLRVAAKTGGWFDDESVLKAYRQERDEALIEAYLAEIIVSRIKFNRDEFREYYEQHVDDFRGPPQVLLGTIMVGTREEADEIVSRLNDGADFGYLRTQYARPGHDAIETEKWVSPEIFSGEMRDEILRLQVGQSSGAFEVAGGWLVFKLKNRRPGEVKTEAEVDPQLREIFFQKKFNELLDEHLALLKERSDIVLHEAAIDEYFGSES
jgi:parvulin-like peptidyl-prolyl isomerase